MLTRCVIAATVTTLLMIGCGKKNAEPTETTPPTDTQTGTEQPAPTGDSGRASITSAECEAQGGRVVGDIGDGAIHRPDYTCEGGKQPLGNISPAGGEPVAVEGSVCCPAA